MRQAYKSNAKTAIPPASNQAAIGNPGEGTPATIVGDRWFWLGSGDHDPRNPGRRDHARRRPGRNEGRYSRTGCGHVRPRHQRRATCAICNRRTTSPTWTMRETRGAT